MFTIFLIGNLASGKSTAARYLESLGARRIDLDVLAKSLYVAGSELVSGLAEEFGWHILDENGEVRTAELARCAFESPESVARLNDLVHPVLKQRLADIIMPVQCCSTVAPKYPLTIVEVSAPMSFLDAFSLADDVVAITAPCDVRRARALDRGMTAEDFESRSAVQPSDEQLCSLARTVIDNTDADDSLFKSLDSYLREKGISLACNGDSHAC